MGMLKWPRRSRIVIEIEGARFEAQGDAPFVERALGLFMRQHSGESGARNLAEPEQLDTEEVRGRRTGFIRLHAIDGPIAKIYPVDGRRLSGGWLDRAVGLARIGNIYIESASLSRQLKGDQKTLWHALMPPAPTQVTSGTSVVR